MFIGNLVGEEGGYDVEEAGDEVVVFDDVACYGWYCEELKGEVFNGGLSFAVDEEVGIDNSVVDIGEMPSWKRRVRKSFD